MRGRWSERRRGLPGQQLVLVGAFASGRWQLLATGRTKPAVFTLLEKQLRMLVKAVTYIG